MKGKFLSASNKQNTILGTDVANKYTPGTNVKAEIKSLTNYGAFVELEPGVEGLIHISDISWIKKVSHPSEIFNKGDIVDACVLSVDKENKKITLGIKQLADNPWHSIEKKLPVGSIVHGIVTKITAFGAFVELDSGIEGLIHVTELCDQAFGKVEDVVEKGSEVTAKVIKIDPEHKKISLSIKEAASQKSPSTYDDIVVKPKKKGEKKKKEKEGETEEESEQESEG